MLLTEDDVLLGAVEGPPRADATLQRAADAGTDLGMPSTDLVEEATGRNPATLLSSGTTSLSQTADNGSRRRSRGACFCDGNRGSCSMR